MPDGVLLLVGSYAAAERDGIHLVNLDPRSGALARLGGIAGIANPSYLAAHPDGNHVYAVADHDGSDTGAVAAFAFDATRSRLVPIDLRSSCGGEPCHIALDARAAHVLVANYADGSVAVFPLASDGRLREASAYRRHHGSGPDPDRQASPHVHQILPDPSGRFVVACDLGSDRLVVYRLDGGTLAEHGSFALAPGSGPRHLAFHPTGRFAYVANELDSTVAALIYDAAAGRFAPLATASTLPADHSATNYPADICVSPDGRFLYVSNRIHDSIVAFAIDTTSGALTAPNWHPSGGAWPRAIAFDPSGGFLLVANQKSDALVSLRVDAASGALSAAATLSLPNPSCVAFVS